MAYGTSASDRLARVREAIDAALTSQAYEVGGSGGRRQQRAKLSDLRALEKDLMAEAAMESDGSGGFNGVLGEQVPMT